MCAGAEMLNGSNRPLAKCFPGFGVNNVYFSMQRGREPMIVALFCPSEPSQKCTGRGGGEGFEPHSCKAMLGSFHSATTSPQITEHWFVPLQSEAWSGLCLLAPVCLREAMIFSEQEVTLPSN